jgi:outer membrane beta-barrel protein
MRAALKLVAPILALIGLTLAAPPTADAGSRPGAKALDEFKKDKKQYNVVQNRFFIKKNRFEIAPVFGYVPNNPFASRYVGGILAAYHFGENFAAEGAFIYSPDLGQNDLKDLTHTLVNIAHEGAEGVEFQQPVDKLVLGATFAARWAPIYGKINLLGERVANFDFYVVAGLGMLSVAKYYAVYDEDASTDGGPPTGLTSLGTKAVVPINLGIGMNFFLSGSVALKLDARSYLYFDKKPQYNPDIPEDDSRLYNNFVASAGISIFFPKMKPRQYDF